MCCPAVTLTLRDNDTPSMSPEQSATAQEEKQKRGGPTEECARALDDQDELALMLIGRPFGEDALLAAAGRAIGKANPSCPPAYESV